MRTGSDVATAFQSHQSAQSGGNAMATTSFMTTTSPSRLLPAHGTPSESTIDVVRREFNEMPGMRLTRAQIRRLWNLSSPECDEVVDALISDGFLVETSTGHLRSTLDLCW